MKKVVKIFLVSVLFLTATTQTSKAQSFLDLLNSSTVQEVVSSVVSDVVPLSASQIAGTWSYSNSACSFESDDFLSQAGGALISSQVNAKLSSIYSSLGLSSDKLSYTFTTSSTFTNSILGQALSGTYTLDSDVITFNYQAVSTIQMFSIDGQISVLGSSLYLYFDASKLMQLISNVAGNVDELSTITSLLESYEGLLLGFELVK